MSHSEQTDTTESDEQLECGHSTDRPSVYVPETGRICRSCRQPFRLEQWPAVLRKTATQHMTGETTTYVTWLVGLDRYGRAVYHDEFRRTILRIVPKHHQAFSADVDGTESIVRSYPPQHGADRGNICNAPDGDVLAVVDRASTKSDEFKKTDLVAWVAEHAQDGDWDAIPKLTLDLLANRVQHFAGTPNDSFPVNAGRSVVDEYSPIDFSLPE